MTWRVLISAPYLLPVPEEFRARLEKEGVEIVTVDVSERLSEAKLLSVIRSIDAAICGDDTVVAQTPALHPLCELCELCASVVNLPGKGTTTETQSSQSLHREKPDCVYSRQT